LNPLCFICPHRRELNEPNHECHITKALRHLTRKFKRKRRDSLERYRAAIEEALINQYSNYLSTLIASMFKGNKEYGRIVLEKALRIRKLR